MLPVARSQTRRWLFAVFASLAFTAQFIVAIMPLAESRFERTLSAHIEQTGTRGHTSHNQATCANCQARSIHGTTAAPLFTAPPIARGSSSYVSAVERGASTPHHPQAHPRAPPQEI